MATLQTPRQEHLLVAMPIMLPQLVVRWRCSQVPPQTRPASVQFALCTVVHRQYAQESDNRAHDKGFHGPLQLSRESRATYTMEGSNLECWEFSKERGWVVLDPSIPANRPAVREDLLFFRCRDLVLIVEKRERWEPPLYTYAPNYIRALPPADSSEAAAQFETLQTQWPEFQRENQREQRETDKRAQLLRAQEEEKRKQAKQEEKAQGATTNP